MNEAQAITEAVAALCTGKIIAHATETCYGFACDALNERAVDRLYAIKKMPKNKPISLMVNSIEMAMQYGIFTKFAKNLAAQFWPGPLTIVVARRLTLPSFVNELSRTVGFRFPDHSLTLKILKKFGGILTTTSANVSTLPSPYSAEEIREQFHRRKLQPDFIIDSGKILHKLPSTVVDCTQEKPFFIRQGEITEKEIYSGLQE